MPDPDSWMCTSSAARFPVPAIVRGSVTYSLSFSLVLPSDLRERLLAAYWAQDTVASNDDVLAFTSCAFSPGRCLVVIARKHVLGPFSMRLWPMSLMQEQSSWHVIVESSRFTPIGDLPHLTDLLNSLLCGDRFGQT
jgi:hypothetical protein